MTAARLRAFAAPPFRVGAPRLWTGLLWLSVIVLTVALLAYPRTMVLEFSPIQSIETVAPLTLFAVLYYCWMIALVAQLLRQGQDRGSLLQSLSLVAVFALVYRGFWDIPLAAIGHQDSILNVGTARYLESTGQVAFGHPNFVYFDFPGLHTVTAVLASVTGLAAQDAATIMLVLMGVILSSLFFLISLVLLRDVRWAGVAALLVMQGSLVFSRLPFYPGMLGFVFVLMFLLLILKQREAVFLRPSLAFANVVLLLAAAVTHLPTSVLMFFILIGIWLTTLAREHHGSVPVSTLVLYAVAPAAWLIYATVTTFDGLAQVIGEFTSNLQGEDFFSEVRIIGASNLGPSVPLWATGIKAFWLVALLGVGTVVALLRLRRAFDLVRAEAQVLGALLGIVLLSVTAMLVSFGGSQFLRYPMYAPIVVAPMLLLFVLDQASSRLRRIGLGVTVVAIVGLSLPTFLASHPTVSMDRSYSYEDSPAKFLAGNAGSVEAMIFAPALGYLPYVEHLPNARYAASPALSELQDEDGVWANLDGQISEFESGQDAVNVYVLSARPRVYYEYNFRLSPEDPRWDAIQSELDGNLKIYDNGFVGLFENDSRR